MKRSIILLLAFILLSDLDAQHLVAPYGITEETRLAGKVSMEFGLPVSSGTMRAYRSTESGAFPMTDTTLLESDGSYLFIGIQPGRYIVRADPDRDVLAYPTYYGDVVAWGDAEVVDVVFETRDSVRDIALREMQVSSFPGDTIQMTGNISYGEGFGKKGTAGRPVTRTSVILLRKKTTSKSTPQEDEVKALVYTDDLGNYSIEGSYSGEYTLIVDIPGLPMISSYEVTIEPNRTVSGLDFEVRDDGIRTSGQVDIGVIPTKGPVAYPNPGNGLVHLEFPVTGDYRVEVYNSVGQVIHASDFPATAGMVSLDLSHQPKGTYVLKIGWGHGVELVKYLIH